MNYVLIPLFALLQVFFAACCFTNTRPGDGAMEAWRWFNEDLERACADWRGCVAYLTTIWVAVSTLCY